MNNSRLIWVNGELISVQNATVNILSPTTQFGINVFEGIRCYWNENEKKLYAFRLEEHYKRLLESAKLLSLENKYSCEDLRKGFFDVIKANGYKEDIAVRQTIYLDGSGSWSSEGPLGMFIAPIPKKSSYDPSIGGLTCSVSSWERINDRAISPRIKVGANYLNSRMAQLEAVKNGYDTAILKNSEGKIAEAPGSCIFIFRSGVLMTPTVTSSILESITRDTVIKIAKNILKIEVIEREIDRTELYIADEVFLCGSAMEITPVKSIDGHEINNGIEGRNTKNLRELYYEIVRGNMKKFNHWLTPID